MFLHSQSKATDLFAAAYSGNIGLFDLLVQKFDLPPDQWMEVCVYLTLVMTLYLISSLPTIGSVYQCSHPSSCLGTPCNGEAPHSKVQMLLAKAEQGVSLTLKCLHVRSSCVLSVQFHVSLILLAVCIKDGKTLLHFAAQSGSIELVDWLIKELGLDVQQVTKVRLTVAECIP